MLWLKQSTVVIFQLGPFVDKDDGVAPETGLATNMDNATTGIRVSKNGAASADRNSATVPAHDDDGYYRIELSATDTDTLGTLHVQYEESGVALPSWKDFMVVNANTFDSFFGSDALQVDVIEQVGTTVPAPNTNGIPDVNVVEFLDVAVAAATASGEINANVTELGGVVQSLTDLKDFADEGYNPATNKVTGVLLTDTVTTYTGNTLQTIDAATLNDITAASIWAVDATNEQTQGTFGQAIGDPVADTTTIYQAVATDATGDNVAVDIVAVKSETVLIVADTGELQGDDVPGLIATAQADLNTITGAAGAIVDSGAATVTVISDAVLNEALAGHTTAGTAGKLIGDMTYTKANELDVNTQSINGAAVVGDGNATPWDGA